MLAGAGLRIPRVSTYQRELIYTLPVCYGTGNGDDFRTVDQLALVLADEGKLEHGSFEFRLHLGVIVYNCHLNV